MPENSYLLNNVKVKMDSKSGMKEEISQNITQKPNKKFLGLKFHMHLYSLSNPKKEKGLNKYLRKIGEEPVVWDSYKTKKSSENIKNYLQQNGYFEANIADSISYKKHRKINIVYYVTPGKSHKVNSFKYEIEDIYIERLVYMDSLNCKIKIGERFKVSDLIEEKKRLQNLFLNYGLYDFKDEDLNNYISYKVDTSLNMKVDITMEIRNPDLETEGIDKHYKYMINNVYIFRNYDPKEYIKDPAKYSKNIDTLCYENLYFLSKNDVKTKPGILTQSNYIVPKQMYNQLNESLTIKHLRSLRIFQDVDIKYKIIEDTFNLKGWKVMNCYINLTPMLRQYYQFDISATNSSVATASSTNIFGNLGAEASLKYQYKNLLGNAEILDVTLRGAAESLFLEVDETRSNSRSIGIETRLHIPKFLMPIKTEKFIKKYSPQTTTSLAYKYYNRPGFYLQNIVNMSFGYNWKGNSYTNHTVDPVRLNFVSVRKDTLFNTLVQEENTYFFESFQNKMITTTDYSFEYNSGGKKPGRDFIYFRYNLELSGNVLNEIYKSFNIEKDTSTNSYTIFNVPFSQYVKTDFDFRYYDVKVNNQTIVYRLFCGIAYPYGNTGSVPFEKRYSIGGPNSVRAWLPNYLGPGTTYDAYRYNITGTSDIKLEFNVEYRFDVFWKLKGALFVDGGNIWSLSDDENRPGASFDINKFYKEIALGTGFGTRFDLDYFVLRFDWGLKIHDPARFPGNGAPSDQSWIFKKGNISRNDWTIQMGVTYPF